MRIRRFALLLVCLLLSCSCAIIVGIIKLHPNDLNSNVHLPNNGNNYAKFHRAQQQHRFDLATSDNASNENSDKILPFFEVILNKINKERTAIGLNKLIWDSSLASEAAEWSTNCWHVPDYTNIHHGQTAFYTIWNDVNPVYEWLKEKHSPVYRKVRTWNLLETSDYTQIVWLTTTKIGCTREFCSEVSVGMSWQPKGYLIICRYDSKVDLPNEEPEQFLC